MKSKERIISDCIKGFYPVLDENGQNIPAYSHDDVLEAMESYATQQTAELQQEVERLKGLFKSMEDEIAFSDRNSIKESQSTIRGILRLIELAIYNPPTR